MKKVCIIGIDTSHATEFPKRFQDPSFEDRAEGIVVTKCMKFLTRFTNPEVIAQRQAYLESIGVTVTESFEEAVEGCDGILLELNDPEMHVEYFRKCAALGKPVFLDKPFADSYVNALEIMKIAKENNTRFYTTSALRYEENLVQAHNASPNPHSVHVWAPCGKAPAGSSVIWYGVHALEMLETLMGRGAATVSAVETPDTTHLTVAYRDGRCASVELHHGFASGWNYGALVRDADGKGSCFNCGSEVYTRALDAMVRFMNGEEVVSIADSLEVMSILDAADRAVVSGRTETVYIKEC